MDTPQLVSIVTLLIALSIASERLVDIIKGVVPFLAQANDDPRKEALRCSSLQVLAVVGGILTAFLARPGIPDGILPESATGVMPVIALGLLASGGSGFWNTVLTYMVKVKDLKKIEVAEKSKG